MKKPVMRFPLIQHQNSKLTLRALVEDNIDAQSTNVKVMEKQRSLQRCFMSRENTLDGDFESLSKLEAAILKQSFLQAVLRLRLLPCC